MTGAQTVAATTPPSTWHMYRAMVGIGLLCGVLIVAVFELTRPVIERNKAEALQRAQMQAGARGVDVVIGSTPDDVAREFAPQAVERGAVVVDESGVTVVVVDGAIVVATVEVGSGLVVGGAVSLRPTPSCSRMPFTR